MRMRRIKAWKGNDGLYHCMSRTVGGEYLLGETEKEVFVRMMWRVANFLGIEIINHVVMSNHYHQTVRVPGKIVIKDEELLKRLIAYYGKDSPKVIAFEKARERKDESFARLKLKYLKRMGNVSEFQKILKQGFSTWYNKRNNRRGTLWMERFKSVLVEDRREALQIIASYIDLNPVRAQMVSDPKDYRYCGYAAALGGDKRCQKGIMKVMGISSWKKAAAGYRVLLMTRGNVEATGKAGIISRQQLLETLESKGELSPSELVRLKVRYFSDGLVLGTELFVEEVFKQNRSLFGNKRKSGSRTIKGLSHSPLRVIRDLRIAPVA